MLLFIIITLIFLKLIFICFLEIVSGLIYLLLAVICLFDDENKLEIWSYQNKSNYIILLMTDSPQKRILSEISHQDDMTSENEYKNPQNYRFQRVN